MSEHNTSTLAEFDQAWLDVIRALPFARLIVTLGKLTRLGERPASLRELATVVGSTAEAEQLLRQNLQVHIVGDVVHWDQPFPGEPPRRTLYVGDREIPMGSGCAPDLFAYAAVLDIPFRAEESCPVTRTPIRVDFVPGGYEHIDPPEAVTLLLPVNGSAPLSGLFADIDATVCVHQPFLASAEAARPWLTARPGSRAFTVPEMFERPFMAYLREELG